MANSKPAASRILVIRYRFIGDTILTVPFLRNLREAYPNAKIDVLVGPQSGEVLQGCPYINELICYDTTRFHKYDSGAGKPRSFWSYVSELKERKYDTAFVLKRSWSAALLPLLIGCRNRIGYGSPPRSLFLTTAVKWNPSIHEVESTLDVLRAADIPIVNTEMESWISASEQSQIEELVPELKSRKPKILFHAAAAHPDKMYPLENWAEVMRGLCESGEYLAFHAGSAQDTKMYEELDRTSGIEAINTSGKLSLQQSMALLANMDLAICTDSGPAHLSAAAGTPTLALFGPTDPERWAPWGTKNLALFDSNLSCRPCNYKKTCDDKRQCLTELSAQAVINAAKNMLLQATRRY